MKSHFSRLKPKIVHYCNFKTFDEQNFIVGVKNANLSFQRDDPNENYSALTNTFSLIVEKHVPYKKKIVRAKHAPFITKDLRKTIYRRSRLNLLKTLLRSTKNYTKDSAIDKKIFFNITIRV